MTELKFTDFMPARFRDAILKLCKDGEANRARILAARKIPESNPKTRNNGGPEDLLKDFYKSKGYWGLLVDARLAKDKRRGLNYSTKVNRIIVENDYYDKEKTYEVLVDGIHEKILVNERDVLQKDEYHRSYQIYNRMRVVYQVLYDSDHKRFACIKELPNLIRQYEIEMENILRDGINRIEEDICPREYSNVDISLETFRNEDTYDLEPSSYRSSATFNEGMDKHIILKGHLDLGQYDMSFIVRKAKKGYEMILYDMTIETAIRINGRNKFFKRIGDRLVRSIPRIRKEYSEVESDNLKLIEKVYEAIKRKNALSKRIKKMLMQLKKENQKIIGNYKACKAVEAVV